MKIIFAAQFGNIDTDMMPAGDICRDELHGLNPDTGFCLDHHAAFGASLPRMPPLAVAWENNPRRLRNNFPLMDMAQCPVVIPFVGKNLSLGRRIGLVPFST